MKRLALFLAPAIAATAELPPPAQRVVDFQKDIQPLFEAACVKCHAKGKEKGGFSLEDRAAFAKGGDSGDAAIAGKSAESLIVQLIASDDPDERMPKKGTEWTPEQIGLLRAWIDQGARWPEGVTFSKPRPHNLDPRKIEALPGAGSPVDRIVAAYFAEQRRPLPRVVDDRVFARRAHLDVTGLLPTPAQLDAFEKDAAPDKHTRLVRSLLADKPAYATHWLTFWNDLLRNDYKGTGFIDGGRRQISGWLYTALYENKPYDRFVAELVNPTPATEGFTQGILWRGNVNAAMTRPMQAAQSVSQVFMGINLKCASCHDSFVDDWALADAYGLAAVYSDEAMELVECDKPLGRQAAVRFLYPEIGGIDPKLDRPARMARLAELLTSPKNGRLSRTIVNRLWARLMGRGLVEPLDNMDQPAWSAPLLDWLAEDLVAHGWDLKRTIEMILTSRAYAMPAVEGPRDEKEAFVFGGPLTRRLTAEQFSDAVSTIAGDWARLPASLEFNFGTEDIAMPHWVWTAEPLDLGVQRPALRAAQARLDTALAKAAEARKKASSLAAAPAAAKTLSAAGAELDAATKQLAAAPQVRAVGQPGEWITRPDGDRHDIVFRKDFVLAGAPREAHAVVVASQGAELFINGGKPVRAVMSDGFRNGRARLFDVAKLLRDGANTVVVKVESHTSKGMNSTEREQFPQSINHLNATPGLAFFLHCDMPDAPVRIITDASWKSRRAPDAGWQEPGTDAAAWAGVALLPQDAAPVDEGTGLMPIKRRDYANVPVLLADILAPAVSIAARVGQSRASLLGADALQTALERPNREIVVPARTGVATTIQALELTNGETLDTRLKAASRRVSAEAARSPAQWIELQFRTLLSRPPVEAERASAIEMLGVNPGEGAVADFLWALFNLPEFQLIN